MRGKAPVFCLHSRLIDRVRDTVYRDGREDKLGWRAAGLVADGLALYLCFGRCFVLFYSKTMAFLPCYDRGRVSLAKDGSGGDGTMPGSV